MTTAVVYFSLSGNTEKIAKDEASRRGADVFEVAQVRPRCTALAMIGALVKGCPYAFLQKSFPLEGKPFDLSSYDTIVIASPMWAMFPAPAFNTIADMVPEGKKVEVLLVSDSGNSRLCEEKVVRALENRGLEVASFVNVKV